MFLQENKEEKTMKREHLKIEQRKIISRMLSTNAKLVEIAELLGVDPTTISKEIKRNREMSKKQYYTKKVCKKLDRYPYCCNGCSLRHSTCIFSQYKYDAVMAQEKADYRLVGSRRGLNITKEEFERVDRIIKTGINNNQSIYHIVHDNDNMPSVPTIYRWIKEKKMTTRSIDLPYAVTYKKRKSLGKYNYNSTKIDRSGRTYLDYLEYRRQFPGEFTVQMDFLGSIVSDSKDILTLTIPELHFVYIKIFENVNQEQIISFFNEIENKLGIHNFKKIFGSILTDRDPCFIDYLGIEFSSITGEQRSRIFYCDSFRSCQKANVENMNKQLRKYFKKGSSINHFSDSQIKEINDIIISQKIASLGGISPKEAFIHVYGKQLLELLFK